MTTPAGGIFWRARIFKEAPLSLEPSFAYDISSHAATPLGIQLTPTMGMVGNPHVQGSMDLNFTPEISMGGSLNPWGMVLTPSIDMTQTAVNVQAALGLSLTPTIGISGTEWYYPSVGLTLTPTIGMNPKNSKFNSAGGGAANGNSDILTETHVINANAKAIIIFANSFGTANAQVYSVTVGGQSATALRANYQYYANYGQYANMAAYGLINPPTGSVSVIVNYSAAAAVAMNSVSYYGAASFASSLVTQGLNGTPSHTVGSTTRRRVVQAFSGYDTSFTGYSKNSRWNRTVSSWCPLIIGDCADHTSETFSANNSEIAWGSIAIPINPS